MMTANETANASREPTPIELTEKELDKVVGGVVLGLRKSAGGTTTGTFFL